MIVMALASIAIIGILGVAVDMGRVFVTKNETQTFCDAGALAGALKLDDSNTGISAARTAVTSTGDAWNFGTQTMPTPTIEFATASTGPWLTNPPSPTNYSFVRVTANAPVTTYFSPILTGQTSMTVQSRAIAARIPVTSLAQGLAPYTAVASDLTSPTFGLIVGQEYDIQWPQYNGSRGNCNAGHPENCFIRPVCAGDSTQARRATMWNMVNTWSSSVSGYWGSSSNSEIRAEVLNLVQLQPATIGQDIVMSTGDKAVEATILDERASQDLDYVDNTPATYDANPLHNGRRLFALPIVTPDGPTSARVVGYGVFLLYSNGSPSNFYNRATNGNDGFCAVFAGQYVVGSTNPGSGNAGAYKVSLIQ
ncbi:MAG: pilus assembly protein TadG-related protein [Bryobacteraceae bacterium]